MGRNRGFHWTPCELRYGMGLTCHGLQCTRVRVRCGKTGPVVYPCGTLLTGWAWMVQVCPLLLRKWIFLCWPAFLGHDRLTLQRISSFWQYIHQSDSKYYRNLNNQIHTLCTGNYNFFVETNGSVAGECEFIVQILKRQSFWWALIPGWRADQVQMALGWTEDGCGCWDVVEF